MDDQRLRDAARKDIAPRVYRSDVQRKQAAVHAAFRDNGDLEPSALQRSLPPLFLAWYLPGPAVAGSNVEREYTLPAGLRLVDISVRAKVAPSGAECKVRLTANGSEVENANLPPGVTFGHSSITGASAARAAGDVLRLDVVTANGAEDVTVLVTYTVPD